MLVLPYGYNSSVSRLPGYHDLTVLSLYYVYVCIQSVPSLGMSYQAPEGTVKTCFQLKVPVYQ